MPLDPGSKLGPYEVLAPIGKGGMGEVYRARDTRIGREVAVKTSAEQFSERFEREARAIASLNHPNICMLFDVGPNYLVMELIEGPTLSDRIKEGAVPLEEALKIAAQIAAALGAAHEKGVVHRDLKPANIKIKSDGSVKVLDFGLAKVGAVATAASEDSPTISMHQTQAGMLLGTAAYMSPEQAKGKPVDKGADIWAFGVVLYEMLTGDQLHQGETLAETLAAVLREQPDWNRVPAQVHPLLRSCLQKDAKDRLRDIADWKLLLVRSEAHRDAGQPPVQAKGLGKWLWPAVAAVLLLAVAVLAVMLLRTPVPVAQEVRSQIPQPEGLTFNPGTQATISPDGKWLAFPALGPDNVNRMYVRSINSLEVKPLPGSEGIISFSPPPFWSYDSRFVVYGALGKLKKSDVNGAPAQTIAETGLGYVQGGTWSRDGVIVYAGDGGILLRVTEAGGTPAPLTALTPGERADRYPQFLPDGKRFLYLRVFSSPEKTGIYVGSIDAKPGEQDMKPLLLTDRQAYWADSETRAGSFLLVQRESTILAQPFDTSSLKLSGAPVPIATEVGSFATATAGLWSVARNGTLMYRSGGSGLPQLTWRDPTGKELGTAGEPGRYDRPEVSPDGARVAFGLRDAQGKLDIWVRDLASGNSTRLTFDKQPAGAPVWSPDGKKIAFAAIRGGSPDLYEKNADNSGEERLLFKSDQTKIPTSWSRDGRFLLFYTEDARMSRDLWVLPLDTLKPFPFLRTEFNEQEGQFSPDGRWIAYTANPTGNDQVYVRPFSRQAGSASGISGPQWMVSTMDGAFPRWSSDGKRLYFISLSGAFMAADVQTGASFQSRMPQRLFGVVNPEVYGVKPNGQLLFSQPAGASGPPPPFTVVLNWMSSLNK